MAKQPGEFSVYLREQDADVLLAAAETAINERMDLGPGLHLSMLEEASRRIEAVADLHRKGVSVDPPEGGIGAAPDPPAPEEDAEIVATLRRQADLWDEVADDRDLSAGDRLDAVENARELRSAAQRWEPPR